MGRFWQHVSLVRSKRGALVEVVPHSKVWPILFESSGSDVLE